MGTENFGTKDFIRSILGASVVRASSGESTITEAINWSPTTHVRIPLGQAFALSVAVVLFWLGLAFLAGGFLLWSEGWIWPVAGCVLSTLFLPAAGFLGYRVALDMADPYNRRSPMERELTKRFDSLLGTEEPPPAKERIVTIQGGAKAPASPPPGNIEARVTRFAEYVNLAQHYQDTTLAAALNWGYTRPEWEGFWAAMIETGAGDYKVYRADGTPAPTKGFAFRLSTEEIWRRIGVWD